MHFTVLTVDFLYFYISTSRLTSTFDKSYSDKYVVKHKSAKLFIMYAVGKLEAAHDSPGCGSKRNFPDTPAQRELQSENF